MSNNKIDLNDNRWGNYIPWFLRCGDNYQGTGNFKLFFERVSHRLYQLFSFNEASIKNLTHFAHMLESKSLQRFKFQEGYNIPHFNEQIQNYFGQNTIEFYVVSELDRLKLQIKVEAKKISKTLSEIPLNTLILGKDIPWEKQKQNFYSYAYTVRLGVLEVLLQILPKNDWFLDFIRDIRSYFAEANIMLDVDKDYKLKLLDEPLLQKEVIENLLPRLESTFPERAKELVKAYHDMLSGSNFDSIFSDAFKTLEEIARAISKNHKFVFDIENLKKYFPKLHQTVHVTILKLKAHRGDKAGHGRTAPEPHEMRYLLFSICNTALLLLDYQP